MKGPEHIETSRLVLRRPVAADAGAIYTRYSSDTEVTKYVGWPRRQSIEQTKAFLAFSEAEWNRWSVGSYLIERQGDRELLGGTGLALKRQRLRPPAMYSLERPGDTAMRLKR